MRALLMSLLFRFPSARLLRIEIALTRILAMSETTQQAVDHVATAVASLKAEVSAGVAAVSAKVTALQAQIAALQAAGSGATADQITSLEASATEIDTDVKALHDGLNPPAP